MRFIIPMLLFFMSCNKENSDNQSSSYRITKNITYNNVSVDIVIDKPITNNPDVLIVYHGTIQSDNELMTATNRALDEFKNILDRNNMMIVSVAHPQEYILFGDNIIQAETALLWVKYKANEELGISVGKIFLAGHSQGGYLVTRLNTMHQTNGVIASAPGPLNLIYRCELEENGQVESSSTCSKLKNVYGLTSENPNAYFERSLLNFTNGFKSDILFIQGLNDSPIQMYSWPIFKQEVMSCTNCQSSQFVEISGGHNALFVSSLNTVAKAEFNNFINNH
jgi:hypothetical protein